MKRTLLFSLAGTLLLVMVGLILRPASSVVAQAATGTPRPTPTNVGDEPRVTPTESAPTDTPEPPPPTNTPEPQPPTNTPEPQEPTAAPTEEPPSPPRRQEESEEPASQSAAPEPQATVATTVPNTGFMDVEGWSALFLALGLVGTIFGARYLRHHHRDEDEKGRGREDSP